MADPIAPPPKPAQPVAQPPPAAAPNQFDAMRRRAAGANQVQMQKAQGQQNESMQRKFAAGGLMNSGAAIKAQQVADQELTGQFNQQFQDQQGGIDEAEAQQSFAASEAQRGRDFQGLEAQKGRDFQGGQFDKSFALDSEMKRAQMGLAQDEMGLKRQDQEFNMAGVMRDRGYGVDLTQAAPGSFRDSSGRLINPNGQGLAYEEQQGVYSQTPEAIERRLQEERVKQAQATFVAPTYSSFRGI